MNLLPRNSSQFSNKDYWNSFFSKRDTSFEWYGDYSTLSSLLSASIYNKKENILVTGAGNSTLTIKLYQAGYTDIESIDISSIVIKQMNAKYPALTYKEMDMLNMSYPNESFSVVLDKGTLDALMSDDNDECLEKAKKYFQEIKRILKTSGRFLCISLLQPFILNTILQWFTKESWVIRFQECPRAQDASASGSYFPVFFINIVKMKPVNGFKSVIQMAKHGGNFDMITLEQVKSEIDSSQRFAFISNKLKKSIDKEIYLDVFSPKDDNLKYRIFILDRVVAKPSLIYAAFIVPYGRDGEWLFNTEKGRIELATISNVRRLMVVHIVQKLEMEDVKTELTEFVQNAKPLDFEGDKISYLSLGDESDEQKKECFKGHSDLSGHFFVEDVQCGPNSPWYRRLVFQSNQMVIQSEVRLKPVKNGKNKKTKKKQVETTYLPNKFHNFMVASLAYLLPFKEDAKVLVLGLGGANLVNFLHFSLPKMQVEAVEIDNQIVEVAHKWFSLPESVKVHIKDGLTFLEEAYESNTHFDVIMVDIDSKDYSVGINCPPLQFIQVPMLKKILTLIGSNGVAAINIVTRDESILTNVVNDIKSVFNKVFIGTSSEELNQVVIATPHNISQEQVHKHFDSLKHIWQEKDSDAKDIEARIVPA